MASCTIVGGRYLVTSNIVKPGQRWELQDPNNKTRTIKIEAMQRTLNGFAARGRDGRGKRAMCSLQRLETGNNCRLLEDDNDGKGNAVDKEVTR